VYLRVRPPVRAGAEMRMMESTMTQR
jgi:hypothetical protein